MPGWNVVTDMCGFVHMERLSEDWIRNPKIYEATNAVAENLKKQGFDVHVVRRGQAAGVLPDIIFFMTGKEPSYSAFPGPQRQNALRDEIKAMPYVVEVTIGADEHF